MELQASRSQWLVLAVLLAAASRVQGHVMLQFPKARNLPLDFMDSFRTPSPCGMPRGEPLSTLIAGTPFNISWHLGYPHQGGYKLELMDAKETVMQKLAPTRRGREWQDDDTTAQNHLVTLPSNMECKGCTIRLTRQALEWGRKYQFWSCADVDIVPLSRLQATDRCSNSGRYQSGACRCDRTYFGPRCQFKNECEEDSDCSNGGRCIDIDSTTLPSKQCFCREGYFGDMCTKSSTLRKRDVEDTSSYTVREVNSNFRFRWKIMPGEEIRVVIEAKTRSFAALGWRPNGMSTTCQAFPDPAGLKYEGSEFELQHGPDGEPEAEAEAESEPENDELQYGPDGEPEAESEPENDELQYGPDGEPEAESEAEPEEEEEEEGYQYGIGGEHDAEGESEPEAEEESEPESEPEGEGESSRQVQGGPRGTSPKKYTLKQQEYHPFAPFRTTKLHPMDCMDVVIGTARNNYFRIMDAYTRDRSTPMADRFYGGQESLTGAYGHESSDGWTTIAFQRKLESFEPTDHTITSELMQVIWATGQPQNNYYHRPKSGLERGNPSIPDFYRDDELKYHGKRNRGQLVMSFMEGEGSSSSCPSSGEWKYPQGCTSNCDYEAEWKNVGSGRSKRLDVVVRQKYQRGSNKWVGIGFSQNSQMRQTDIVLGYMTSNRGRVRDFWAAGYSVREDGRQNVENASLEIVDGYMVMKFKRQHSTRDSQDIDIGSQPVRLIFPYSGGSVSGGKVSKHDNTPFVLAEQVDLSQTC